MLPTYQRVSGGGGQPTAGSVNPLLGRRSFRSREKCLIFLVLSTFGFVCFGGFFFLPDNFSADRVLKAYKQFQRAGPEIFIPPPPPAHGRTGEADFHKLDDREKLQEKIRRELPDEFLEKPDTGGSDGGGGDGVLQQTGEDYERSRNNIAAIAPVLDGQEMNRQEQHLQNQVHRKDSPDVERPAGVVQPPQIGQKEAEQEWQSAVHRLHAAELGHESITFNSSTGEDRDPIARDKRNKIKQVEQVHAHDW